MNTFFRARSSVPAAAASLLPATSALAQPAPEAEMPLEIAPAQVLETITLTTAPIETTGSVECRFVFSDAKLKEEEWKDHRYPVRLFPGTGSHSVYVEARIHTAPAAKRRKKT